MKDKLGKFLMEWRIRSVIPHIKGRLLDIGCGTNQLVKTYKGEGVGVDVYQWGDVDLIAEDSASLSIEDKEFDTVSIIASLNHIPNRQEVLREANRILKDDGIIVITMITPRISEIWHRLREPWDVDQRERGMKEGEVFGLQVKEVAALLENAGFKIIYRARFMFFINMITVARK